jgi:hypothetical protein
MLFFGKRFDHLFLPFSGEYQSAGEPISGGKNVGTPKELLMGSPAAK